MTYQHDEAGKNLTRSINKTGAFYQSKLSSWKTKICVKKDKVTIDR